MGYSGSYTLQHEENKPIVIRSDCDLSVALYMGKWILLSFSFFKSSATPLSYWGADKLTGSVSSAAFVLDNLAIVIDGRLYIYSWIYTTWTAAYGVNSTVTTVSSVQCCFSKDKSCMDVSSVVLLYNMGSRLQDHQLYDSLNGGYNFSNLALDTEPDLFIIGLFNMPTVSSIVAMVMDDQNRFTFRYLTVFQEMYVEFHPMEDPLSSLHSVQPPGVILMPVYFGENEETLPPPNISILQVAADGNGVIVVLTSDGKLYYGRFGLEAYTVRLPTVLDLSKDNLMLINDYGDLVFIHAIEDFIFGGVTFHPDLIILQQELTNTIPPLNHCPVEQFHSLFEGDLFYIDMDSNVHLSIGYTPSHLCQFFPLVTLTNSLLLSCIVKVVENGITTEGTKKYRLEIELDQEPYMIFKDGTIHSSPLKGSLSTLSVDLMGRTATCKDFNPVTAHIIIGCPPGKHIRINSHVNACTKGVFSHEQLQDNFSYVIPKTVYDPKGLFQPGSASKDLHLQYSVMDYFCPLLVYSDVPWIPFLELWDGDVFVEVVRADFVMQEMNGMFNYNYLQTAKDAKCVSQPQSWTSQLADQQYPNPNTAWTRYVLNNVVFYDICFLLSLIQNYRSCWEKSNYSLNNPLQELQVLNMHRGNKMVFPNYNGMFIFKAIVVDPSYSYCELSTTFSVFVYGAFPPRPLPPGVTLGVFLAVFLVVLVLGFFFRTVKHLPK
ncbi:cation channel sperm-associated auxiliary subunit delta-like [Aplochiton taeniatus]